MEEGCSDTFSQVSQFVIMVDSESQSRKNWCEAKAEQKKKKKKTRMKSTTKLMNM